MVAHGGENPTRKANARRHVVHAAVIANRRTAQLTTIKKIK
jgi:hypothetical protein